MKINNNISEVKFFKNGQMRFNNKFERSPMQDTVSFQGKINPAPHSAICEEPPVKISSFQDTAQINQDNQYNNVSENNIIALEFAKKLSDECLKKSFSLEKFEELIYKYDWMETAVKPMDELEYYISGLDPNYYNAFFMCDMRGDYTPCNKKMFLEIPDNNDDKSKLCFVMSASHEFTHLLQSKSNKEFNLLKDLSGGDLEEAETISSVSNKIFSEFENKMKGDAINFITVNQNYGEMFKYNMIMPKPMFVSQGDILKSLNLKSTDEFNDKCQNIFNQEFDKAIQNSSCQNSYTAQIVSDEDSLNNLKEKVKKYVQLQASKEKEAYLTESLTAKRILNNENGLNIDSIPMFYEMLETALT